MTISEIPATEEELEEHSFKTRKIAQETTDDDSGDEADEGVGQEDADEDL